MIRKLYPRLYGRKNQRACRGILSRSSSSGKVFGNDSRQTQVGPSHKSCFGSASNFTLNDEHGRAIFDLSLSTQFTEHFQGEGALWAWLEEGGKLPLPPYIEQADELDNDRYQTVFAKEPGAVAAPTAGLHFTQLRRPSK